MTRALPPGAWRARRCWCPVPGGHHARTGSAQALPGSQPAPRLLLVEIAEGETGSERLLGARRAFKNDFRTVGKAGYQHTVIYGRN